MIIIGMLAIFVGPIAIFILSWHQKENIMIIHYVGPGSSAIHLGAISGHIAHNWTCKW